MIRLIVIVSILCAFLVMPTRVEAQSVTCLNYNWPNEDQGWDIVSGSVNGLDVESINSIAPTVVGNAGKRIEVILTVPSAKRFRNVEVLAFSTSNQVTSLTYETSLGGNLMETFKFGSNRPNQWLPNIVYFRGQPADTLRIILELETPTNKLGLRVKQVCTEFAVTMTPTSSKTSTPSNTPSITPTASLTWTPGGPTPTPPPLTTDTLTPSLEPLFQDEGLFATIPPPEQCANVGNPCGVMPFPLPEFTAISFQSPVPVTSVALQASKTMISPPLTVTPGGPTLTPHDGESAISIYATNLASAANDIIQTPSLLDNHDQEMTIRDQANEIGTYAGSFFGIVRAIQSLFLGKTGTIIFFLLLIVGFIVLVRLILFVIPIILAFFRTVVAVFTALNPF